VKVCALLVKDKARPDGINADYVGFEIPDKFVVGNGLDYAELYQPALHRGAEILGEVLALAR